MTSGEFESLWQKIESEKTRGSRAVVVFTGAGVSTLSGIKDFRGQGGLYTQPWHGHSVEDILSLTSFMSDPSVFYGWAREFCYCLDRFSPNIVHRAVARLEELGYTNGVITQNIDVLHQKAGSRQVFEFHGSPSMHHCLRCRRAFDYDAIAPTVMKGEVPTCTCGGVIKPDIIFYGESINTRVMEKCFEMASAARVMIVLGSSLLVQPAASIPVIAREAGATLCIVNAQSTPLDKIAHYKFDDLATFAQEIVAKIGDATNDEYKA